MIKQFTKLLLGLVLLMIAGATKAQVSAYTFAASSGTYTDITGGTPVSTTISAADFLDDTRTSISIPIGFSFTFNSISYTNVVAVSDGFLSFNTAATSTFTNNLSTSTAARRPLVAPLWDDLDGASGSGAANYITTGASGSRIFTIEWKNWQWQYDATGATISFQVKLYEGSNKIEFIYRPESGALSNPSASIGIAGVATGSGNFLSLNNATTAPTASSTTETTSIATKPAAGQIYAFTPPPPPAIDMSINTVSVPATACSGSNYPVNVTIKNNGTDPINFATNNALVTVNITGAATQSLTTTVNTGTLTPNATQVVTVAPNATLSAAGTYTLTATVTVTGDANSSNNSSTVTYSSPGNVIVTVPWLEGFTTTTTPAGWSVTGWTISSVRGVTGNPGNNIYKNLYSLAPTGTFTTLQVGPVAATNQFTFDYKVALYASPYGVPADGWGNFKVQLSTDCGATFTVIDSIFTASASWVTKTYPLSAYAGQNVIIRIKADWLAGDYDLGFDNFKIETPAACPTPTSINVTSLTSNSASISFTSTGSNFVLEYGAAGFTPGTGATAGTGGTVVTGTASPVALTGLTPNITYQVYVRQNCTAAGNGYSSNSAAVSFTTNALPPANDACDNAVNLTVSNGFCSSPVLGTLAGADSTNGLGTASCQTSALKIDVWYKVTVPASGSVTIQTSAVNTTVTDLVLEAYSGTCRGLTSVGCNDDGNPDPGTSANHPKLGLTGRTPGEVIYLRVMPYSTITNAGSFAICAFDTSASVMPSIASGLANTCTPANSFIVDSAWKYAWVPLKDAGGNIVAEIYPNGNILGTITASYYRNTGAVRSAGAYYLDRNFTITPANQPGASRPSIRLYFTNAELTAFAAVAGTTTRDQLMITKNADPCSGVFTQNGKVALGALNASAAYGANHYIEDSVSSFSSFFIHRTGTVLPISLEYLKGLRTGTGNALNWKVNCTSTSITMELERSSDSRTFKSITSITATQVRCGQPFDYTDATPLKGTNYYRLKMIDVDGKITYSPIVAIINGGSGAELVGIYPTVVRDEAFLSIAASRNTKMQINITDMSGRVIKTISQTVANGSTLVSINTAQLSTGVYNITGMLDGVHTKTLRFVKQ